MYHHTILAIHKFLVEAQQFCRWSGQHQSSCCHLSMHSSTIRVLDTRYSHSDTAKTRIRLSKLKWSELRKSTNATTFECETTVYSPSSRGTVLQTHQCSLLACLLACKYSPSAHTTRLHSEHVDAIWAVLHREQHTIQTQDLIRIPIMTNDLTMLIIPARFCIARNNLGMCSCSSRKHSSDLSVT